MRLGGDGVSGWLRMDKEVGKEQKAEQIER
jgi:hypothetical protein